MRFEDNYVLQLEQPMTDWIQFDWTEDQESLRNAGRQRDIASLPNLSAHFREKFTMCLESSKRSDFDVILSGMQLLM